MYIVNNLRKVCIMKRNLNHLKLLDLRIALKRDFRKNRTHRWCYGSDQSRYQRGSFRGFA